MLWVAFIAGVLVLLALDLFVFHRHAHAVSVREALIWSAVWIGLSLAFNGFVAVRFGADAGLDFLTAYLLEKSLSVDNLFVFVVIFAAFGVLPKDQHRVLFWGVVGALVMRAGLIFGGLALLQHFSWLVYPMGAFLAFTGVKLFLDRNRDSSDPGRLVRWLSARRGLLFVILAIEATDLVFALDSVPAVLAVTDEPFIVFTSNICALLGLRSLYFAVAHLVDRFEHLKVSLAVILVFVGAKLAFSHAVHVPHGLSLAFVALALGAGVVTSLWHRRVPAEPKGVQVHRSGARG